MQNNEKEKKQACSIKFGKIQSSKNRNFKKIVKKVKKNFENGSKIWISKQNQHIIKPLMSIATEGLWKDRSNFGDPLFNYLSDLCISLILVQFLQIFLEFRKTFKSVRAIISHPEFVHMIETHSIPSWPFMSLKN